MVSISPKGLKLIEAVAPTSEAIYAEITHRYGARKLAELQDMLANWNAAWPRWKWPVRATPRLTSKHKFA